MLFLFSSNCFFLFFVESCWIFLHAIEVGLALKQKQPISGLGISSPTKCYSNVCFSFCGLLIIVGYSFHPFNRLFLLCFFNDEVDLFVCSSYGFISNTCLFQKCTNNLCSNRKQCLVKIAYCSSLETFLSWIVATSHHLQSLSFEAAKYC